MCQLHTAMAALVQTWFLRNSTTSERVLDKAARKIDYHQRRNANARKSHTKTTRRKLRELGIKLTEIPRCQWNST